MNRAGIAAGFSLLSLALGPAPGSQSVTLTIRCGCAELKSGDEIPITFTITNTGPSIYPYTHRSYDRSGRIPELELTAFQNGARVPDPRSRGTLGTIGGGLGSLRELKPGESFSMTIPLNLWAVVNAPGEYDVHARWVPYPGEPASASPIRIHVLPRTDAEMGAYIAALARELRSSMPRPPARVIQRLMYTMDPRAADALRHINADDNNTRFWIEYALAYYLRK